MAEKKISSAEENIRSPIVSVLGHVDHGKSTILDNIRGTSIVSTEPGMITQAIGASIIPLSVIKEKCGELLKTLNMQFTIPGLLFIDTPGHAAFTNLRKRGGNLADIAILVIDINEGFKPQTFEALEILRAYKTPFVIAANKIDLIPGCVRKDDNLVKNLGLQEPGVIEKVEARIYEIVGILYEKFKLEAERFDRCDFTKQVAIIPCSGKTGEGIPELLMLITGLAQKYLENCLKCNIKGAGKGTVLEVKEEKGIGYCIDVILYDGAIKVNDIIVIAGLEKPVSTKVRALFKPLALNEMRDKKAKFDSVKKVSAATAVRISAPELEGVIAGMPLLVATSSNLDEVKESVQKEVEHVIFDIKEDGIIIKADNLGSLEAMINILNERNIPIRRASIGEITKKDISDAETNYEKDPLKAVILGFNVKSPEEKFDKVKLICGDIIYRIVEEFEKWLEEEKKRMESRDLDKLVRPSKVEILQNCIFRQSNPAVVGVEVLSGIIKPGTPLMKQGKPLTTIKSIQSENENVSLAEKGKQVAVSLPNVTVGRQIAERDILYSAIPEDDFRKIKKLTKYLNQSEIQTLKEIANIMREQNPMWGV